MPAKPVMNTMRNRKSQSGLVLLEALIAMFIFSIGVLGMVGMFALSIKNSGEGEFRTEAGFLADSLIAQLRTADPSTRSTDFASPSGSSYTAWKNRVTSAGTGLPGASATPPTVTFSGTASQIVTITINWKSKNYEQNPDNVVHTFIMETYLDTCSPPPCI